MKSARSRDLKAFLDATLAKISGKSSFAGAIHYATSRWAALIRLVDDGRVEMTNNAAERAIRPLALGRNYAHPVIMRSRPRRRPANHLHSLAVPSWRSCA